MSNMLEIAKLTKNPFTLVPEAEVSVWAGYEDLRKKLLDIIKSCRSDRVGLSEFLILHGEIGTGKSHDLRYLRNWIENERVDEYQAKVVYLESMKFSPKMDFIAVYRRIIEELHNHIQETAIWLDNAIESSIPKEPAIRADEINEKKDLIYNNKDITPSFPPLALLLKGIKQNDDNARDILIGKTNININLSKYGMPSPIDSEFSAARCLGAYINLCTRGAPALADTAGKGRNRAFYLFFDEIELLGDFKPAEVISINQGVRDLINACPENTCLIFAMTGDVRDIFGLFEKHVMGRMSREPIEIIPLDDTQAISFIRQVLKSFRSTKEVPDEYPFREAALRKIIEATQHKTARELFKGCRRVLEMAVLEDRLKPEGWIEEKDVEELM